MAHAYRAAVSQILKLDHGREDLEVQGLDVDALISRFRNLSSLSPTSLSTYWSRFRSALASYVSYLENPASYQPRGRRNTSRGDRTRPKGKGMEEPEAGPEEADGPSPVPPPLLPDWSSIRSQCDRSCSPSSSCRLTSPWRRRADWVGSWRPSP